MTDRTATPPPAITADDRLRVERGAQLLDRIQPEWAWAIDPRTLQCYREAWIEAITIRRTR